MAIAASSVLAGALVALSAAGGVYLAGAVWAVRRLFAAPPPVPPGGAPVSVLKPLHGADAGLADNLRSLIAQDHPHFQIVCGVEDARDAAVPIVRALGAAHPAADLALVVAAAAHGSNRKVANLANMLPAARHALLVIADSDMRVRPDYLRAVTAPLGDPAIGLVTCLYRGLPAAGAWSKLACLHINHGFLPQAAVGHALGLGAGCFGATIALRRATLEAAGGFAAIADDLADDHALGAAVRRAGQKILLSPHLVDNIVSEPSFKALFRHELRWARTIRLVAPAGFAGLLLTQPVALAALALLSGGLPAVSLAMLAAALAARGWACRAVERALGLPRAPLVLLPVRDLLSFAVFLASFFARKVAWREHSFRVGAKGELIVDGDGPA